MLRPTVYLVRPLSPEGEEWLDENTPDDAPRLGNSLAVEWRYIDDILSGMLLDGLVAGVDFEVVP